jgi:hypothetical protein
MNFSFTEDESESPLPPAAFQTAAGTFITALSFSIHHRETLSSSFDPSSVFIQSWANRR